MKNGEILVRMPVKGKIVVSALGKGKGKLEAVAMLEEVRPQLRRLFEKWYLMQFTSPINVDVKKGMK